MKKWTVGIVLIVIGGALFWVAFPKKEHLPALPKEVGKPESMQEIKITSRAFENNQSIPSHYTCDGTPPAGEVNPPLEVSNPSGTLFPSKQGTGKAKTLALVMHDPDAPREGGWTHWVIYNIKMENENSKMTIGEGEEPIGIAGKGTGGELTYQGPCPPSGTHRYFFTIYALDTELSLKEGASKAELESAMQGHILGQGQLIGLYSRKR